MSRSATLHLFIFVMLLSACVSLGEDHAAATPPASTTASLPIAATPTPQPLVPPAQVEQEARALAVRTRPERDVITAEIDRVSVELITVQELQRRHPQSWSHLPDASAPVYRVELRGFFCMGGMAPGLYRTETRIFMFDARTGQEMGESTGPTVPATDCAVCAARAPADLVTQADVIVRGRLLAAEHRPNAQGVFDAFPRWTFAVAETWKGAPPAMVEIEVNWRGGRDTHIEMQLGEEYLVLAQQREQGLRTDACAGTAPVGAALPELMRVLGQPRQ